MTGAKAEQQTDKRGFSMTMTHDTPRGTAVPFRTQTNNQKHRQQIASAIVARRRRVRTQSCMFRSRAVATGGTVHVHGAPAPPSPGMRTRATGPALSLSLSLSCSRTRSSVCVSECVNVCVYVCVCVCERERERERAMECGQFRYANRSESVGRDGGGAGRGGRGMTAWEPVTLARAACLTTQLQQ